MHDPVIRQTVKSVAPDTLAPDGFRQGKFTEQGIVPCVEGRVKTTILWNARHLIGQNIDPGQIVRLVQGGQIVQPPQIKQGRVIKQNRPVIARSAMHNAVGRGRNPAGAQIVFIKP